MSFDESFLDRYGDPRVKNWFLMSSFHPTLLLCASYVIVAKKIGPNFMKDRKPFKLRSTMITYNLFQIFCNILLFRALLLSGWLTRFNLRCEPIKTLQNSDSGIVDVTFWFYILKFTEFLETAVFVLRKKSKQVSTLHLIYHAAMPISGKICQKQLENVLSTFFLVWIGLKFVPEAQNSAFMIVNTLSHVFVYTYYLTSALKIKTNWKKFVTVMQILQCVAIIFHSFQVLAINCQHPKCVSVIIGLHGVFYLRKLINFYRETYFDKQNRIKK